MSLEIQLHLKLYIVTVKVRHFVRLIYYLPTITHVN